MSSFFFNRVYIITIMNNLTLTCLAVMLCKNKHSVHIWYNFYCLTIHSALHIVLVLRWLDNDPSRPCASWSCCLSACIVCLCFNRLCDFVFNLILLGVSVDGFLDFLCWPLVCLIVFPFGVWIR